MVDIYVRVPESGLRDWSAKPVKGEILSWVQIPPRTLILLGEIK